MTDQNKIRNFSIIAHVDHGKSTLADRILLQTGTITEREFKEQILDDMDLERERGITIKASAVRIRYKAKDGETYLLNLIDTPGHVDFSYEVSKSIAACEGVLLLVDASQGVQAQTVANLYLAMEHNIQIIPVINKVDLPSADVNQVKEQIEHLLGLDADDALLVSAKTGDGVEGVLTRIVDKIPPPTGKGTNPLQVLIFDSYFDSYKGVIVYVRVVNGELIPGMQIRMMQSGKVFEIVELGVFKPKAKSIKTLKSGEVGYISCNIKSAKDVLVGDTITDNKNPTQSMLPGYKESRPMVFSGIYPINNADYNALRDAVEKLRLSDSSFVFEPESSASLGQGFRCGFLGLLHLEIIQERLQRDFDLNLIVTTPSVVYHVKTKNGKKIKVDNPMKLPPPEKIFSAQEPYVRAFMLIPKEYLGDLMTLSESRRGIYVSTEFLDETRVQIIYEFPLAEIIVDFYDKIKSLSKGYGSLDYEFVNYRSTKIVKLEIYVNNEPFDALSSLIFNERAVMRARNIVAKLKETIPRHLFQVPIQAAIGGKVIARETVRAIGKNVTAKCYGGDITRKRKLWERQKEGKKRMKQFGKVEIPQEAFLAALKAM